jgi:hypothetical protein
VIGARTMHALDLGDGVGLPPRGRGRLLSPTAMPRRLRTAWGTDAVMMVPVTGGATTTFAPGACATADAGQCNAYGLAVPHRYERPLLAVTQRRRHDEPR